jgi:hypothetical protein
MWQTWLGRGVAIFPVWSISGTERRPEEWVGEELLGVEGEGEEGGVLDRRLSLSSWRMGGGESLVRGIAEVGK